MSVLFCRHGNTFAPGETPVMVGANEDLPLVASGIAQAERMRDAIGAWPGVIIAGPLQRTRQFAQILGGTVSIDPRLRELDYGTWAGLSDAQIEARGDGEALVRWRDDTLWPAAFAETEAAVRARLQAFVSELTDKTIVVTSQGILKLLGAGRKVATGHACIATLPLQFVAWNLSPDAVRQFE